MRLGVFAPHVCAIRSLLNLRPSCSEDVSRTTPLYKKNRTHLAPARMMRRKRWFQKKFITANRALCQNSRLKLSHWVFIPPPAAGKNSICLCSTNRLQWTKQGFVAAMHRGAAPRKQKCLVLVRAYYACTLSPLPSSSSERGEKKYCGIPSPSGRSSRWWRNGLICTFLSHRKRMQSAECSH